MISQVISDLRHVQLGLSAVDAGLCSESRSLPMHAACPCPTFPPGVSLGQPMIKRQVRWTAMAHVHVHAPFDQKSEGAE